MEEYGILKRIKVKVAVNETTGKISYRTAFKGKDADGKDLWGSLFINFVQDAKNKPISSDTYIKIKKGFLSPNRDANTGNIRFSLVVQDFDFDNETPQEFGDSSDFDDALPF